MTNINMIKKNRRKRKANRVTFALTLIFIITFLSLMMTLGNMNSYGDGDVEYVEIRVRAGDSLWSIADQATPEHRDLRETMYEISKVNELDDEIVYPGQVLQVPKVY